MISSLLVGSIKFWSIPIFMIGHEISKIDGTSESIILLFTITSLCPYTLSSLYQYWYLSKLSVNPALVPMSIMVVGLFSSLISFEKMGIKYEQRVITFV